jgi:hypothetical protein
MACLFGDRAVRGVGPEKCVPTVSQISLGRCCSCVDTVSEAFVEMKTNEARSDIEAVIRARYGRIARVIASVTRDRARAEELAVEVFLKMDGCTAPRASWNCAGVSV